MDRAESGGPKPRAGQPDDNGKPDGFGLPPAASPDLAGLDQESFATAVFAKLGLIATAQSYGFGAEWENVRNGPEFERQWKGRGLVAELVKEGYADQEMTAMLPVIEAETMLVWGRQDGLAPL